MRARPCTRVLFWTSITAVAACNHDPDGLGGGSFASGHSGGDGTEDGGDDDDDDTSEGGSSGVDSGPDPSADPSADPTAADDDTSASAGDDAPQTTADSADDSADSGPDSAGGDIGECSNFTSVEQFHSWLNTERQQYAGGFGGLGHDRYKGLPWQGEGHQNFTFSAQFAWDDGLAATAQAEAEAIASGAASPSGGQSNGSNGLPFCPAKPFWIDGLNTSNWKISFAELAEDWMPPADHPDSCPAPFALSADNQHARMGLLYHDFGGDGPAIHSVGVGAAIGDDCQVWWVLQFGT